MVEYLFLYKAPVLQFSLLTGLQEYHRIIFGNFEGITNKNRIF